MRIQRSELKGMRVKSKNPRPEPTPPPPPPPPPQVNVAPQVLAQSLPDPNLQAIAQGLQKLAEQGTPVVNVKPAPPAAPAYSFEIERNRQGLIERIIARPLEV